MLIIVPDSKLRAACQCRKLAIREFGNPAGCRLIQRVCELMAADSMDDFRNAHVSEVTIGDPPPDTTIQVHVKDSLNLVLRPVCAPTPDDSAQAMNWAAIKEIELLTIAR